MGEGLCERVLRFRVSGEATFDERGIDAKRIALLHVARAHPAVLAAEIVAAWAHRRRCQRRADKRLARRGDFRSCG